MEGVQPEVDVTFSDYFYSHFLFNWVFDTPYLMRFWNNVRVTSIKTHWRGFLCVCYSYISRSKVIFCQRGLLVPVRKIYVENLCVKANAKIAENSYFDLLYLSSHIHKYIHKYHKYIYEYEYIYIYIYIICIYIIYICIYIQI